MISTFLEALNSFLKICMPLLGIYVIFLAEASMKNISFGGERLLSEYAGIFIVERINFNSLNNTNATHRRINEPIMDKNIIDVTNDSIKKMIKVGDRYLEHKEKVSRRIANRHKGKILFICN